MNLRIKKTLITLASLNLIASFAIQANDVTLGIGAGYATQPYLGVSNDVVPLPVVRFENEHFFINTTKAGYFLWNDGQQKINLNVSYNGQSFRGRDSNHAGMRTLDRRRDTAMMGLGYDVSGVFGKFGADISADILNRSNGIIADANYSYPITQDLLTVAPVAGVKWNSSNFNDYHFGITQHESNRTANAGARLNAYSASSGVSPYMGANINFRMTDNWNAFGLAQHTFLNSEIKDSPMISSSGQTLVGGGISYSF